ncbi:unnamed protein product [Effrenium voratum]|nr:unnamed protein product [Effrenium voratum]
MLFVFGPCCKSTPGNTAAICLEAFAKGSPLQAVTEAAFKALADGALMVVVADGCEEQVPEILAQLSSAPPAPPLATRWDEAALWASGGRTAGPPFPALAGRRDESGNTLLHIAASAGCCRAVQQLLQSRIPVTALNRQEMSPADVAFQRGHQDAFEQLVLHRVGELGNLQAPAKKRRGASKGCREYLLQPLRYEEGRLLDDRRKAVMMAWEAQLMARHAEVLLPQKGLKVLNVGFGMGLVDGFLQEKEPSLHVIVEAHKDVLAEMRRRGWHARPGVKVYEGVWQDILSQLPGGFDAVFFDTWAEGYEELSCFQAALPRLLGVEGRFSFFNGLAPWSVAEHAAWCRLAQEDLQELGFCCGFLPLEIRQGDWQGVCERYWQFDTYYLPLARRDPTWEASWRGWPTFPVHVSDQMGVKLPLREFGLCTGDLGGDN